MKKVLILLFVLTFSISLANDIEIKKFGDLIVLETGTIVKGEIINFGNNSFKMESVDGRITKIKNDEVALVAVSQDMSSEEKFQLGKLDGKRFATKRGGNYALGFLGGLTFFGAIVMPPVIYFTSKQSPSIEAQNGSNKIIIDDKDYLEGYSNGARSRSFGKSLSGALTGLGGFFLFAVAALSSGPH